MADEKPSLILDHLFRSEYGKVMAALTHKFGTQHLEKIEDAVQDSFLRAMHLWGYTAMPDNPTAWLLRVSSNRLIDIFRKDKKISFQDWLPKDSEKRNPTMKETILDTAIADSQLKMIFACCHPSLSQEYQIILSLKLIGGFGNKEIADALLKKEEAVAKAFTRAKRKLKEKIKTLESPIEIGLQSRLLVVLKVIYLLFSEGYAATSGVMPIKRDICYEAIRLALLLRENKFCRHPNLEALIALMCFHASRFEARVDDNMELVDLEHQDRSLYNMELLKIGIFHLENAGTMDRSPSNYHLEAAVSYYHSSAKTFGETDWKEILKLYNLQLQLQYSPVVAINRIMPLYKVKGARCAMDSLNDLRNSKRFKMSALFYAIEAELFTHLKQNAKAISSLGQAIYLSDNVLEKRHFTKKMENLQG